ncbi:hypothetical protein M3Y99_01224200 [Aphelenchoides fujianensis]|nr:hypothetical protein M3Y99_01224200 [Aphelenchoides fujianensis]
MESLSIQRRRAAVQKRAIRRVAPLAERDVASTSADLSAASIDCSPLTCDQQTTVHSSLDTRAPSAATEERISGAMAADFSTNTRSTRSNRRAVSSSALPLVVFLLVSFLGACVDARPAVTAKCFFFGPGTTIEGADYRREYGASLQQCAASCKSDVSCMGFEWLETRCTLKSRSLNGTIKALPDAYFGLCVDYDDGDRDNFWEHELGGKVVASKEKIDREACVQMCGFQEDAVIYSWKAADEQDSDAMGDCSCIGVLHSVKLSFGSAAGFLE